MSHRNSYTFQRKQQVLKEWTPRGSPFQITLMNSPESYKTRQRAPHNTLRGNAPRLTSTNLITYYLPILESLFRRPVVKGPAINTLFLIEKWSQVLFDRKPDWFALKVKTGWADEVVRRALATNWKSWICKTTVFGRTRTQTDSQNHLKQTHNMPVLYLCSF